MLGFPADLMGASALGLIAATMEAIVVVATMVEIAEAAAVVIVGVAAMGAGAVKAMLAVVVAMAAGLRAATYRGIVAAWMTMFPPSSMEKRPHVYLPGSSYLTPRR
jgi:hypothetical protein